MRKESNAWDERNMGCRKKRRNGRPAPPSVHAEENGTVELVLKSDAAHAGRRRRVNQQARSELNGGGRLHSTNAVDSSTQSGGVQLVKSRKRCDCTRDGERRGPRARGPGAGVGGDCSGAAGWVYLGLAALCGCVLTRMHVVLPVDDVAGSVARVAQDFFENRIRRCPSAPFNRTAAAVARSTDF